MTAKSYSFGPRMRSLLASAAVGVPPLVLSIAAAAAPPPVAPPPPGPPAAARAAVPTASPSPLLDELADLVEKNFYSPMRLAQIGWRTAVESARQPYAKAPDPASRTAILRDLVARLATSHSEFYPRDDPAYWALASIFEPALPRMCQRERLPGLPISHDEVGVFWKRVGTEWFVGGVYGGGPADQAGLRLGDRIVSADGRPFSPVRAFADKAGTSVQLEVQRMQDGAPLRLGVTPRPTKPQEEFTQASAASWRIIEYLDREIAYFRIWAWTSIEIQRVVLDLIAQSNAASVDGFILDLRDGWGGAATSYLGMFFQQVPVLVSVDRDGKERRLDSQLRRPTVMLINRGTRSGKETIAYGAKKHHLATLIGERTAGAVNFGRPFCLSDGSMLLLAVADARVDDERLEGQGVAPDVEVPFDFRYAAGRDPQLDRALEFLTKSAVAR